MEYAYSIIMGCFAAALFIYAMLMALSGDYKILPIRSRQSVEPKDPKKYTRQLSKVIALVALSPALSALAGLFNAAVAVAVLIGSMILFIWLGTKIMKGVE
ncbi:MAG: hypothetical protein IK086_01540 [Clostridia bacterium]|nr:hypothetical protein [Clostridia bacterium]